MVLAAASTFLTDLVSGLTASLTPLLVNIAIGLIGGLAAQTMRWVMARKAIADHEYVKGVVARLYDAIVIAVKATQQETVADIKAASATGRIDPTVAAEIKAQAIARAKAYVGEHGISEALKIFAPDELDRLMNDHLESAVHDLRVTERQCAADS